MLWLVALVTGQVVVSDEGAQQGIAKRFNFTGSGVSATVSGGTATVRVTGGGGAGSGAPTDAKYIVQQCNADISAEQCMSQLGTGLVQNTTTTGVQSIYAGTNCTNQFPRSLSASGAATCASVSLSADVTGILPQASGGTGAGAVTCSSGQALTSNGTAQSCTSTLTASDVACSGTCIADVALFTPTTRRTVAPISTSLEGPTRTPASKEPPSRGSHPPKPPSGKVAPISQFAVHNGFSFSSAEAPTVEKNDGAPALSSSTTETGA